MAKIKRAKVTDAGGRVLFEGDVWSVQEVGRAGSARLEIQRRGDGPPPAFIGLPDLTFSGPNLSLTVEEVEEPAKGGRGQAAGKAGAGAKTASQEWEAHLAALTAPGRMTKAEAVALLVDAQPDLHRRYLAEVSAAKSN